MWNLNVEGKGACVDVLSRELARRAAERTLSKDEKSRYSRHLLLPEVGGEGQRKLRSARVLIIGAGGLGSPVALYLAAAGVGTLGLADFDRVEASNLQRQIIHGHADVGRPKVDSARERIEGLDPGVTVTVHPVNVTGENALDLIEQYDVVVDGSDNFATRYLVNDCCVLLNKPNVHGSVFRFEGQASVFYAPHGPCYRCLFPEPPPPGHMPNCAEGGVLGVLPGQIGLIQATETIKLILGVGRTLVGRLLMFDALGMGFEELKIGKWRDCPACGASPTITEPIDYQVFCGGDAAAEALAPDEHLSVTALKELRDQGVDHVLVDVRSPGEADICRIAGSRLIPQRKLAEAVGDWPRDRLLVVHCRSGVRSAESVVALKKMGFTRARSLDGGILAWLAAYDDEQPAY